MMFWTGVAVGATAMYFFDPQNGSHRRAAARETYERLRPTVAARVEAAEPTIRELGQRVRGAAGKVPALHVLKGGRGDEAPPAEPPAERPAIMAGLSETQMEELTRQFGERDRQAWDALTASYGWTTAQADEAWRWFEQRPAADPTATAA
jgi:hypothetical protein